MPTKRKRIRRKKTLRGGIPFIPGTKTKSDNISNCENYWSTGRRRDRCSDNEYAGKDINYPGKAKQLLEYFPTYKPASGKTGRVPFEKY